MQQTQQKLLETMNGRREGWMVRKNTLHRKKTLMVDMYRISRDNWVWYDRQNDDKLNGMWITLSSSWIQLPSRVGSWRRCLCPNFYSSDSLPCNRLFFFFSVFFFLSCTLGPLLKMAKTSMLQRRRKKHKLPNGESNLIHKTQIRSRWHFLFGINLTTANAKLMNITISNWCTSSRVLLQAPDPEQRHFYHDDWARTSSCIYIYIYIFSICSTNFLH